MSSRERKINMDMVFKKIFKKFIELKISFRLTGTMEYKIEYMILKQHFDTLL